MEQWNNVELTSINKKSYTLNHEYDGAQKQAKANSTTTTSEATPNTNGNDAVLEPGSDIKPNLKLEDVEPLVRRLYGITISEVKELLAYDDRNYFIKEDW
ncbi:CG31751 [Drosophila busckii]|uniref:CG31751 n=1 Tax=Drosophila busckii TaxID=30019 RepID=A0A0M4E4E0_DROBS|nr:CG31751 [Drosophila busckii]